MSRRLAISLLALAGAARAEDGVAFFESRVRPVLVERCYGCHGAEKQKGGLRLDSRDAVRTGGDSGPALVPGRPEESRLVRAVRHTDKSLKMPPDKKLSAEQVADLERWVAIGAPDPRDHPPSASAETDWDAIVRERRTWWSLQPVRRPAVPDVSDPEWAGNPVDRFIKSKLDAERLAPAALADRTVLARRLGFVLTGLPPNPEDVLAFEADSSPVAVDHFVDRLLADPAFGERWARHWMDVVRYADTYGYEWDIPARGSWRYRDYLIQAFNADVPFDQLVREQLAGDLLTDPRVRDGINESLTGPMFFQLGEKRHGDSAQFNGIHQEMLDNKIDAFSKAVQAMTVACAKCHDHKLDAVAQRDYYALAGVFMSARWVANTLDMPDRNRETIGRLRAIKRDLRREVGEWWKAELDRRGDTWAKATAAASSNDLPLEHPLRPWQAMVRAERDQRDLAAVWDALSAVYAVTGRERAARNARDVREVTDFRGWSVDGVGLRDGPVKSGNFTVSLAGPRVVNRIVSAGWVTDAESPRLNGAVRTPFLRTLDAKYISFLVQGGDFAAERTVVDNAFLTERQSYLPGEPMWKTYSMTPELKDRAVYVEFATKASNPNFPPRVGLGPELTAAQINDPRSWFDINRVVTHELPGPPADELTRFARLFTGEVPHALGAVRQRYAVWFREAADAWAADRATDDHVRVLNWLLQSEMLPNEAPPARVAELLSAYRMTEATLLDPRTVNGMAGMDPPTDYRLNIRGDYDRLGPAVPRGYLQIFARPGLASGSASGRLALAEFVASSENPLTARVYVNRVWHWLFGAGLVTTPDDFGHLGDRPVHPELLDWLASWFVENGRSTKKLIRLLVTSRTFRQGSDSTEAARQADPRNRLWHHYPLRRLEAEAIRDSILATSGRLVRRLYGPPIDPPRTAEDPQKRLFSGPPDGDGRRSIYTKCTIMDPPRFLAAFNQPPAKIPTGRRDVTNVPAQALAMLNDPFVVGQSAEWGRRLAAEPSTTTVERIREVFQTALGRSPTTAELERWARLVNDLAAQHGVPVAQIIASPVVWKEVAHTLYNSKEFLYLR
jgi:cytochrome c553